MFVGSIFVVLSSSTIPEECVTELGSPPSNAMEDFFLG